jgi:hypothetical protein
MPYGLREADLPAACVVALLLLALPFVSRWFDARRRGASDDR